MEHCFRRFGVEFVVQCDPSEIVEPSKGPFDNPPERNYAELFRALVWPEHHLKLATESLAHLLPQLIAPVPAIGQYLLEPRKLMGETSRCRLRAFAVVDVRLVDGHGHGETERVDNDLFLAPLHLLVAVYSAFLVDVLAGLDAPRVDDAHARGLVPSERDAQLLPQGVHHALKDTFALPLGEVVENDVVRREVLGGHAPLAAGFVDVKYAVHDVPERILSLSCLWFQNFLQYLPLIIGKVSWVFSFHI